MYLPGSVAVLKTATHIFSMGLILGSKGRRADLFSKNSICSGLYVGYPQDRYTLFITSSGYPQPPRATDYGRGI